MKMKFEVTLSRVEYNVIVKHMETLMDRLHSHFPTLTKKSKDEAIVAMKRDLNRIPGIEIKAKSMFGGLMFAAGLRDNIEVVAEIETNYDAIDAVFDISGVLADIFGPFANAAYLVTNGRALSEIKTVYNQYSRMSKPQEFSIVRQTTTVNEEK